MGVNPTNNPGIHVTRWAVLADREKHGVRGPPINGRKYMGNWGEITLLIGAPFHSMKIVFWAPPCSFEQINRIPKPEWADSLFKPTICQGTIGCTPNVRVLPWYFVFSRDSWG